MNYFISIERSFYQNFKKFIRIIDTGYHSKFIMDWIEVCDRKERRDKIIPIVLLRQSGWIIPIL